MNVRRGIVVDERKKICLAHPHSEIPFFSRPRVAASTRENEFDLRWHRDFRIADDDDLERFVPQGEAASNALPEGGRIAMQWNDDGNTWCSTRFWT